MWEVSRPGDRALLYFSGNAKDVTDNVEQFAVAFPDCSLYLVNYRGYGGSTGRPAVAWLVLVTAFCSLVNVAREYLRWLPVSLLMRDRHESARRAPQVSAPVLVVIADEDEIIRRVRSDVLAAAFAPS